MIGSALRPPAGSWWDGVRRALRLRPARPAYGLALASLLPAAAFAVSAALWQVWAQVGVAYLAVACAAVFMVGSLRTQVVTLMTQCAGALIGISVGVLAGHSWPWGIALPTGVALVAGAVGVIGPALTAASLMAVIGVAYAQFAGSNVPWWQMCLWYSAGTAALAVPWVLALLIYGRRQDRTLISDVLQRSADLLEAVGTPLAPRRRADLAEASARCRDALQDHLLRPTALAGEYAAAVGVALDAASADAAGQVVTAAQVAAIRASADQVGRPAARSPDVVAPEQMRASERFRRAGAEATAPAAVRAGLRLAVCIGTASVAARLLHGNSHSFWLPLTVAVLVRPEYGSVFGRTVNRAVGSVAGAVVAVGVLTVWATGLPVAMGAAFALAVGLLLSHYSYSFSVAGATASALLCSCINNPDPLIPAVRLVDTLLGCVLAVVFGYLIWPDQRHGADSTRIGPAVAAATTYFDRAITGGPDVAAVRDTAYRTAHRLAAQALSSIDEPPPASTRAARMLPLVLELEQMVDQISALAATPDPDAAGRIKGRLDELAAQEQR